MIFCLGSSCKKRDLFSKFEGKGAKDTIESSEMIALDNGKSQTLLYCNRTFVNETIENIKPKLFRSMKRKPCEDETIIIESLLDRMAISHDYLLSTEEIKKKRENSRTASEENYLTLCLAVRRLILDERGIS